MTIVRGIPRTLLTVLGVALVTVIFATTASAATYGLQGRIPRYGSETYNQTPLYTTSQFNDINFKYTVNPYSSKVKPVKCSNFADISTYKTFAANSHTEKVIASSVLDGTCFYINIDSDTTNYWDFIAQIRA